MVVIQETYLKQMDLKGEKVFLIEAQMVIILLKRQLVKVVVFKIMVVKKKLLLQREEWQGKEVQLKNLPKKRE